VVRVGAAVAIPKLVIIAGSEGASAPLLLESADPGVNRIADIERRLPAELSVLNDGPLKIIECAGSVRCGKTVKEDVKRRKPSLNYAEADEIRAPANLNHVSAGKTREGA
jgi:hypothetical protein